MEIGAGTTIVKEGNETILKISCFGDPYFAPLEESELFMAKVIYRILQYGHVDRVQLVERRVFEYDAAQTQMLVEIAEIIKYIKASKDLYRPYQIGRRALADFIPDAFKFVYKLVGDTLARDPAGAYVELVRRIRREEIEAEKEGRPEFAQAKRYYVKNILSVIKGMFDRATIFRVAGAELEGLKEGDRSLYRKLFKPLVRPNFTFTRLMAEYPKDGESIDSYKVRGADVTIFRIKNDVRPLYHIMPPEFKLSEMEFTILDEARNVLLKHEPTSEEFMDMEKIRAGIHDVSLDLIREGAGRHGYEMKHSDMERVAEILARETVGYGILELILADPKIQDVTINSPPGVNPIYILHSDFEDCQTNVVPTREEVESWAARLRLQSGRPLDQSNPVLDTSVVLPGSRARVAAITRSLSPYGLAFAFRRHRDDPWTLPLFIKNRMINPLGAGLLSFFADGARTLLVAGTRSSGKTSLLGALMLEIMRKYRVITVEDTLELPVQSLIKLNYNIQSLKVQSAITSLTTELSATDGIRASLRLGDSCLIVGEVRGKETVALYEAMRVGALANMVAGTIHGDSPYGVYDRVVNDLKVPPTSFKATDVIVVANPIRTADGLHRVRRVVQIAEVRKHWETDPLKEKGFINLMDYDAKTDELQPTKELTEGESEVISSIASRVKEWVGNFDAVWENIMLRASIKKKIVELSEASGNRAILEAPFVVRSNDVFHIFSEQVKGELGALDSKEIYSRWEEWAKAAAKGGV